MYSQIASNILLLWTMVIVINIAVVLNINIMCAHGFIIVFGWRSIRQCVIREMKIDVNIWGEWEIIAILNGNFEVIDNCLWK